MLRLVLIVLAGLIAAPYLPLSASQAALAISLSIKEVLLLALPLIVFTYIVACLAHLRDGMIGFLLTLVAALCLSNFTASMFSFTLLKSGVFAFVQVPVHVSPLTTLQPLWSFSLPRIIANSHALLGGAVVGIALARLGTPNALHWIDYAKNRASWVLNHLFIPILPIFILGFLIKLQHDGVLATMVISYAMVFVVLALVCCVYCILAFGVVTRFKPSSWLAAVHTNMSAIVSAFCTMSSAATLPLTLAAAERTTQRPEAVRIIVPSTVSIHLIGDALCVPVLAMLVLQSFEQAMPNLADFIVFAGSMVLAKFAVAAVPGGGILVMLPLLESLLGFTPAMSALIVTLYILFDPLITATNVAGNGAFAMGLARLMPMRSSVATSGGTRKAS